MIRFKKQQDVSAKVTELLSMGYSEIPASQMTSLEVNTVARLYRGRGFSARKAGPCRLFVKSKNPPRYESLSFRVGGRVVTTKPSRVVECIPAPNVLIEESRREME